MRIIKTTDNKQRECGRCLGTANTTYKILESYYIVSYPKIDRFLVVHEQTNRVVSEHRSFFLAEKGIERHFRKGVKTWPKE